MDPSKTIPFLGTKPANTIKRGDANYVQVIHSSFCGIQKPLGDVDIYVKYKGNSFLEELTDKHALGVYLHVATATKRLYVIADEKESGKGTIILRIGQNIRQPKPNECLVGIYGSLNPFIEGKKFVISLKNRTNLFWGALGDFSGYEIFFELPEIPKKEENKTDGIRRRIPKIGQSL